MHTIRHQTLSAMIRSIVLSLLVVCVSSCTNAQSRQPKYKLVWQEEFNGNVLDSSSWSKIKRANINWCAYMTDDARLYDLKRGRLRLYARVNNGLLPNDTAHYLTGGISTEGKHLIKYGKIEIRARLHGAIGTWPAMWLFAQDKKARKYSNPRYAEIDIVEYYNRDKVVYHTIHTDYTLSLKQTKHPLNQKNSKIKNEKYNIYMIEILPDGIFLSINGEKTFSYPRLLGTNASQYPFDQDLYLMLDMQVLRPYRYTVDDATFPAYMDIDWVKMYRYME